MLVPEYSLPLTDQQRQELINRYRNLLTICRPYLRHGDTNLIRKAFNVAMWSSQDKTTCLNQPGIFFALDMTEILAVEAGLGSTSLICSLLFSAYMDGKIEDKAIKQSFGDQAIVILRGLKKLTSIQTGKTSIQSENFIQLILSLCQDVRTLLIKMAESLYYLRILSQVPKADQEVKANVAYYLYAPLAHRLGLYHIKTELEDLSMRFLHPAQYQMISNKLKETNRIRETYISDFIKPIQLELEKNDLRFEIKSRTKSVHSIWTKIEKQKVPFEEVFDILAIRIILDSTADKEKEDCWRVYSVVTNIYPPNPARLRDWISAPKTSGYESLHTTVQGPEKKWVEVQIRTRRMDEVAEKGHAAHWKYKESKTAAHPTEWAAQIRELLEHPDKDLNTSPSSLPSQTTDIYVFTPTGDLKRLPAGATVLDFAFEIHTNLGFQCTGAKVNGKIQPIKYPLNNGEEVEIITAKNQKPKSDWLSFLKTPRARAKVKRALKEEEMKEAETGKEILMRKFRNWKLPFNDEQINKIIKTLKYKTPIDLYQAIAEEKLDPARIKDIFFMPVKQEEPHPVDEDSDQKELLKNIASQKNDFIFLDQNLAGINYTLATCCNPIFGDDVFGFVTISKGITIHRKNCPNAADLQKYEYRIIQVQWRENPTATAFQTSIKISGIDELGIVNTISDIISNEMKVNMRSISIESNNGLFDGLIKLLVSDTRHLDMLLHKLLKVKGVLKATRQD